MRGQVPPTASMPAWAPSLMALRRGLAGAPDPPSRSSRRSARGARRRHAVSSATSPTRSPPTSRCIDSELSAAVFPRAARLLRAGARGDRHGGDRSRLRRADADRMAAPRRSRRTRRTRCRRRCCRRSRRGTPRAAAQRPSRRVGAGDRVPARGHRRVARAARGAGRLEPVVDAARLRPRRVSRSARAGRATVCSPCTACT